MKIYILTVGYSDKTHQELKKEHNHEILAVRTTMNGAHTAFKSAIEAAETKYGYKVTSNLPDLVTPQTEVSAIVATPDNRHWFELRITPMEI